MICAHTVRRLRPGTFVVNGVYEVVVDWNVTSAPA
jgi:hypothetical protein